MPTFGYAGKILRVDLSSGIVTNQPTSDYADQFLGGRGIAAKIYWDEVPPEVGPFDPENRLVFATGPLGGLPAIGGSRWTVCGKSPEPALECFSYGNLGGRYGAELKFAGFDAIVVHGKSEKPVYLHIRNDTAEFKDASHLWGKGAIETRESLKSELGRSARVVTFGPAGENGVAIASLLADNDSSASGGLGASMGAKNLKAIVVEGAGKKVNVAQPERWRELLAYYNRIVRGQFEFMSRWVRNYFVEFKTTPGPEMKKEPCYGCVSKCPRKVYEATDGRKGKFFCGAALFYQPRADEYYGDWNEVGGDVPFSATKLCDEYGMDVFAIDLIISWLDSCHREGILSEQDTGIPLSKIGSLEFIETLVRKIALRQGFGDVLAQGLFRAADSLGPAAKAQIETIGYQAEPGLYPWYGPKLYMFNAFPTAMEPRVPIQQLHELSLMLAKWVASTYGLQKITSEVFRNIAKKFWGSELAADFSTYEGKAMAAKMVQDREYAKECLILCDFLWPIIEVEHTEDLVGDPTLESQILSAVTGTEVSEQGLYRIGERVFNLQRAILAREGHRGRDFDRLPESSYTLPLAYDHAIPDCQAPGKDGEPISKVGAVVDRDQFEKMKDEYYGIRKWDPATGLQTRKQLEELGLRDIADDLETRDLLASS
ncbi:MAG: hypothetical protein JRJ20_02675 [Deltaproteobacteria bacterium]|nr:hypothetical protein [Deltaproteobacteria bacterium]